MGCGLSKNSVTKDIWFTHKSKKVRLSSDDRSSDREPLASPCNPASSNLATSKQNEDEAVFNLEYKPDNAAVLSSLPHLYPDRNCDLHKHPISYDCTQDHEKHSPHDDMATPLSRTSIDSQRQASLSHRETSLSPSANMDWSEHKRMQTITTSAMRVQGTRCFSPKQVSNSKGIGNKSYRAKNSSKRTNSEVASSPPTAALETITPNAEAASPRVSVPPLHEITDAELAMQKNGNNQSRDVKDSPDAFLEKPVRMIEHVQHSLPYPWDSSDQLAGLAAWSNLSSPRLHMKHLLDPLQKFSVSPRLSTTPRNWTAMLGDSDIENLDLDIQNMELDDDAPHYYSSVEDNDRNMCNGSGKTTSHSLDNLQDQAVDGVHSSSSCSKFLIRS